MMVNPLVVTPSSTGQRSRTHKEELGGRIENVRGDGNTASVHGDRCRSQGPQLVKNVDNMCLSAACLVTFSTISGS